MYIERQDIDNVVDEKTLIQLTNDDPRAVECYEPKIVSIIDYVNELINDNLRGRYNLPLSIIPSTIKEIAKSIAKYKLYELRDKNSDKNIKSFEIAMQNLKDYRDGKILIEDYSPTQPISNNITTNYREKKFNLW